MYIPEFTPGARLPHAWISNSNPAPSPDSTLNATPKTRSTLDLCRPDQFTVILILVNGEGRNMNLNTFRDMERPNSTNSISSRNQQDIDGERLKLLDEHRRMQEQLDAPDLEHSGLIKAWVHGLDFEFLDDDEDNDDQEKEEKEEEEEDDDETKSSLPDEASSTITSASSSSSNSVPGFVQGLIDLDLRDNNRGTYEDGHEEIVGVLARPDQHILSVIRRGTSASDVKEVVRLYLGAL